MTVHASSIAEYDRVAISNDFTLASGIAQYASTNYKPKELLDKTTNKAVKRLKSLSITEFKAKGNNIEASNEILEEINQAISSLEMGNGLNFRRRCRMVRNYFKAAEINSNCR